MLRLERSIRSDFGEAQPHLMCEWTLTGLALFNKNFSLDSGVSLITLRKQPPLTGADESLKDLFSQIINEARSLPVDVSVSGDITSTISFSDDEIPGVTWLP